MTGMPTELADLDPDGLRAEASRLTGTDGFHFAEELDQLATALDGQARLTDDGRRAVRAGLVGALVTQAQLDDLVRRQPDIPDTPVPRPIFITGLLRTGTTLVHNLLAQHPDLRVPLLWELMNPAAGRLDDADQVRLTNRAQSYVEEYYQVAPDLAKIHFLDARRPDECHRLTGNALHSMVYEMRYRVPGYADWLARQDMTGAYRYHRLQLQAILWARPGHPVVLKCPFHLWRLDALLRVYPDARIVRMHRTPTATVPSTGSLCAAIRVARSGHLDRTEIGRQWLTRIESVLTGDAARRAAPGGRVLDVRYADLVADPIGTLRRICDFAGVALTGTAAGRMRAYLAENPRTRHGVHRYTAADFGLREDDLDTRFADYRKQFDL